MPLLVDAHEDLAYNMLTFGRDYTRSAHETRRLEYDTQVPRWNHGECLLGWPDYQRGQVALIFATLFALPIRHREGEWDRLAYRDAGQANRLYRESLEIYQRLFDRHPGHFRPVTTQAELLATLEPWESSFPSSEPSLPDQDIPWIDRSLTSIPGAEHAPSAAKEEGESGLPVGLVLSIEGAEGIRSPAELEEWWAAGVRWIGPAWVSGNQYCGGNKEPGPLTRAGQDLLAGMADIGFGLDVTHMDPEAALQALDIFPGPVIASHSNPSAVVKGEQNNRHLSDRLIHAILEHDGMIGIVPFNAFLKGEWSWSLLNGKDLVRLEDIAAHVDYICQLAGDSHHVGFGTDFDGGFGLPGVPREIDTIADLQKLVPVLAEKGYNSNDIEAIFGGNWVSILQRTLPTA